MGRKAKLHTSLLSEKVNCHLAKGSDYFPTNFQVKSLFSSVEACIWNALRSFPGEQHSKSLEYYLKAKCHIWTATLQKASPFYCKTPDLLGEPLIFSLKLYRHLSRLQMTISKELSGILRYASSFHPIIMSWRVKA